MNSSYNKLILVQECKMVKNATCNLKKQLPSDSINPVKF